MTLFKPFKPFKLCQQAFLIALAGALATGFAAGAAGAEFQGRVVDLQRNPLSGVKVTLEPQGIVAVTVADGSFRLSDASPPATLVRPASGPTLGFRMAPGIPAADLRGRLSRTEGNRWLFLVSYSGTVAGTAASRSRSSLSLAKTSGASRLKAEKPGFQTAYLPLGADPAIPDIVLATGLDLSQPMVITPSNGFVVPPLPRMIGFSGSTSTELPNLTDPGDTANGRIESVPFLLHWDFSTEAGVPIHVRRSSHFPRFPEGADTTTPEAVSNDTGYAGLAIQEKAVMQGKQLVPPENAAAFVNLILWKRAPGNGYGAMRCLQFPGPAKAGWKGLEEVEGLPSRVTTTFTGSVPALDRCGKLSGKIAWQGPGPMPELWIGMIGTDLFAPIAPDGTFLSTDLPPGQPHVVLVRVDRSEDGAAVPRAFQPLPGLEVISGQTAVLDSLILAGE